jgi:hypothetical protein
MRIPFEFFIRITVFLSFLLFMSCSKKNPTGPADSANGDFKTGTSTVYTVSGSGAISVKDSVSGATFLFPDGGNGTLSVAPIISAPDVGIPSTRVDVKYTGSDKIAMAVPHTEGYEEMVYIYGEIPNTSVQGGKPGDKAWLGVLPTEKRADATVFTLSSLTTWTAKRALSGDEIDHVSISKLKLDSEEMKRRTECTSRIQAAIDFWLKNLPKELSDAAKKKIEGDTKYSIAWSSEGSYYWAPDKTFFIQVDGDLDRRANVHTYAHEAGHYMNHVLVGTERFRDIANRVVDPDNHGYADYFEGRKYVSEEYAFLSDYLITGTVESTDLTNPNMISIFGSSGPEVKDFPSFEGYGSVMFGSLLRKQPVVISPWSKKSGTINAPVVGAPIGDVLALVAKGAREPNELRGFIQDYIDSRGNDQRFKLPAIMEPLGWSYNGAGTVVDKSSKPVKGAHVQSVCQDGTNEYKTFLSTATGDDGTFILSRIYPGTNILRIFWNGDKDSINVSFNADWAKPTNVSLKMGTFAIDTTSPPITLTQTNSLLTTIGWGTEDYDKMARVTLTATLQATGVGIEVSETREGFTRIKVPVNTPVTASVTVTFTKTMINDHNPYGAKFIVEDPVFLPKNNISYAYGAAQITDKSSDSAMACDFTFVTKQNGFGIQPKGEASCTVGGDENGKFVIYSNWAELIHGPTFWFEPK